jgi:glycosyltransferase involved in cell wall biosynthesis
VSAPRFSIVITCYNQREFIASAVDSALSQSPRFREVIVVDDASTDGSRDVLKKYGRSIEFITLSHNLGAVEARNQGAARARGHYLVFLDGDDVLMPWALEVYERLISMRNPTLLLGTYVKFSGRVPSLSSQDVPTGIDFVEYPTIFAKDRAAGLCASTYVVERQKFWEVGGWTPGIFQLDLQDLTTKLALSRVILILSPNAAFYRIHASNSILSVPPFLRNLHELLKKERTGEYPGGRKCRIARYGWFGGLAWFWTRRAVRAGHFEDAFILVMSAWPMILVSAFRRAVARIKGRRPIETADVLF